MAITTLDGYIGALKERLTWVKPIATTTAVAGVPFTMFGVGGNPGAGVLDVGNTANGLVHTDAVVGYPVINAPVGIPYVSRVEFASTVACRLLLFDRLFVAGAYAFNADVTLTAQPSYAGRVPGGTDFRNLELWIETVTAFTGNPSFQINYLNQAGLAGDSGVFASGAALTLRRCMRIPFAAGDVGIQRVDRVRCTVATAGTFNVMVLRPLWMGRVIIANWGDVHDLLRTGLPRIWNDSALYILVAADGASSGFPELNIEVASA